MTVKHSDLKLNTLKNYIFISNSVIPLNSSLNTNIIADTGCSGHYDGVKPNTTLTQNPINVKLPNGGQMTSTHTQLLDIPSLPPEARIQHLFPEMSTTGLLSIGQLCDYGCTAKFSKRRLVIRDKNNTVIIIGHRIPFEDNGYTTGMWMVHLDQNKPPATIEHISNAIVLADTTKKDLAQLHPSLGFPVPSTLLDAIEQGFLSTFPGLTKKLVRKHLPKSLQTGKGHLDQERQNLQSTKTKPTTQVPAPPNTKTNILITAIVPATDKIYTDLTGKFPVQSSLGNKYILITYHYDANCILAEPLKDRTAGEIANAHQRVYSYLTLRGLKPKYEVLDNECSGHLIQMMTKNKIEFQLVPPHLHRANAAERAIRTWKNHFVSILCGLDPKFPLQLWD